MYAYKIQKKYANRLFMLLREKTLLHTILTSKYVLRNWLKYIIGFLTNSTSKVKKSKIDRSM